MNYKTNFKTLKTVYQIAKKMGLLGLLTGNNEGKGEGEINLISITTQLFEHNTINEFCQAVTGSDEDFEEKDINELEGVILGFFEHTKESWNRLKLAGMIGNVAEMSPSPTVAELSPSPQKTKSE